MIPEIEPLDDDVLALVRTEKPIADLDPGAKAAILATVEKRIDLPEPPDGGGGSGSDGAGGATGSGVVAGTRAGLAGARAVLAIAATFTLGVATGVIAGPSLERSSTGRGSIAVTAGDVTLPAPASSDPSVARTVAVESLPSAAATARAKQARVEPRERIEALPSSSGLAAERGLLDVARAALARGEAAKAFSAVDQHGREYPDGILVEEREALAVKALVALGRRDDARARALRFEQRFPNGLTRHTVAGAVERP